MSEQDPSAKLSTAPLDTVAFAAEHLEQSASMHADEQKSFDKAVARGRAIYVAETWQNTSPQRENDICFLMAPFDDDDISYDDCRPIAEWLASAIDQCFDSEPGGRVDSYGDDKNPEGMVVYFEDPEATKKMEAFQEKLPEIFNALKQAGSSLDSTNETPEHQIATVEECIAYSQNIAAKFIDALMESSVCRTQNGEACLIADVEWDDGEALDEHEFSNFCQDLYMRLSELGIVCATAQGASKHQTGNCLLLLFDQDRAILNSKSSDEDGITAEPVDPNTPQHVEHILAPVEQKATLIKQKLSQVWPAMEASIRKNYALHSLQDHFISEQEKATTDALFGVIRLLNNSLEGIVADHTQPIVEGGDAHSAIYLDSSNWDLDGADVEDIIDQFNHVVTEVIPNPLEGTEHPCHIGEWLEQASEESQLEMPEGCNMALTFPHADSIAEVISLFNEHYKQIVESARNMVIGKDAKSTLTH